jgi:ferritin-like metal-binding protein YciE
MATKKKSAEHTALHDILVSKMQALYDVEGEIIKTLPKMAKKASDPDLKEGFETHLEETKNQVKRLEKAFSLLGEKPKKLKSAGIRGIVADGAWVMTTIKGSEAMDANLIAAAQYVEHYEIAGYGSAVEWAREMGHTEVADLLEETLEEEKATDKKLNNLATSKINERAAETDEGGGEKSLVEEVFS